MALVIFNQSFAAALSPNFSSTIFINSLKALIPRYAPSVDTQTVIDAGATGLRTDVAGREWAGVLVAYAKSVDRVFYLTAEVAVGYFVFAWGMGWRDLREKDEDSEA